MKRSDAILKLESILGITDNVLAEKIMSACEEVGMVPPEAIIEYEGYMFNVQEWEPEEKLPFGEMNHRAKQAEALDKLTELARETGIDYN